MEQLIESLATDFAVTTTPCSSVPVRFDLFKKKPSRQEQRRSEFLLRQKEKRYDAVQHVRNLADGFPGLPGEERDDAMDANDSEEAAGPQRPPRSYNGQLMLSEWLVEVPDMSQYIVKLCPRGKRALLVASRGITNLYARNGYNFTKFASNLPGGSTKANSKANWRSNDFTILDVVFNRDLQTCYVLDLIAWRSMHYYNSDTTFRFYWLETQFNESAEAIASTQRKIKLEVVPNFAWDKDKLESIMLGKTQPLSYPLDGILFYHKDVHYNPGGCPLVGWLKPYMLPEVLGIEVHQTYFTEVPDDYTSLKNRVDEKQKKKSDRRSFASSKANASPAAEVSDP